MKQVIALFISIICVLYLSAQQVELSFPALAGKETKIYWFEGTQTDSLVLLLDEKGYAKGPIPTGYKGIIRLVIPNSGLAELIGGEPQLKVEGYESYISKDNIKISNSAENDFLFRVFGQRSMNLNKTGWIEAGLQMYDPETELYRLLSDEKRKNEASTAEIDKEISESELFAARFMEFIEFINNVGMVLDSPVPVDTKELKNSFHNKLDWNALYRTGNFWEISISYYAGLFNVENPGLDKKEKGIKFAEDVLPLLNTMDEPVRSAFFKSIFTECDRHGWENAKNNILSYVGEKGISIKAPTEYTKRILAAFQTGEGNKAPAIEGLNPTDHNGKILLVFYEAGCSSCEEELDKIKANYSLLTKQNVRIVSISANTEKEEYEAYSSTFPWPDKLCDFKGFEGSNYKNYGVLGVPNICVIDKDGVITGRYADVMDTGLIK